MKSILFGSIGSLVESSEIQRKAFNEAFNEFGVDWYWNVANYIKMLEKPCGLNRLIEYSKFELNQEDTLNIVVKNLSNQIDFSKFDLITDDQLIKKRKPDPEIYNYALKKLNVDFKNSIAIENTLESCNSSNAAKIYTIFSPGEYTSYDEDTVISKDIFKSVISFFEEG